MQFTVNRVIVGALSAPTTTSFEEVLARPQSNVFIDGKADASLAPAIQAMLARGEVYMRECKRRKVTFLPKQVMRPILATKGLTDGPLLKPREPNLLMDFLKS